MYDRILEYVSDGQAPRLNCTWQPEQDWDYGFQPHGPVRCNSTRPHFDMPDSLSKA